MVLKKRVNINMKTLMTRMGMKNQKKDLKWIGSQQRAALENTVGRHKRNGRQKKDAFALHGYSSLH